MSIMDFNDALHAYQGAKLSDYSIADLRVLRQKCAEQVFQQGQIMRDVISSIDYHIGIKEAAETEVRENARHQSVMADQRNLKIAVDRLAKPHLVLWLTLLAGAIAALAGVILLVVEIVKAFRGDK